MLQKKYVDGFVLVVPKAHVDAYKEMAELGKRIWMKHGALSYVESMLEDPHSGYAKIHFPQLAQAGEDETVWFSYIEFESREHRDAVNKAVMEDPEMQPGEEMEKQMPFDMSKMAYGGFTIEVGS